MEPLCRFSDVLSSCACFEGWLNRYQTLLVGLLALTLAGFQIWIAIRQAAISSRQTEIMNAESEREETHAERAALEEGFNAAIELLASMLINYDHAWKFKKGDADYLSFDLKKYREDSDRRVVIAAGQELREALRQAGDTNWKVAGPITAKYPYDFLRIRRAVQLALDASAKLDPQKRRLIEPLELPRLQHDIERLFDRDVAMQEIQANAHIPDLNEIPGALS